MTRRDHSTTLRPSIPSRLVTLLLFLLAQLVVVLLIGSVAVAVSFDPLWSKGAGPAGSSRQATLPGFPPLSGGLSRRGQVPAPRCTGGRSLRTLMFSSPGRFVMGAIP